MSKENLHHPSGSKFRRAIRTGVTAIGIAIFAPFLSSCEQSANDSVAENTGVLENCDLHLRQLERVNDEYSLGLFECDNQYAVALLKKDGQGEKQLQPIGAVYSDPETDDISSGWFSEKDPLNPDKGVRFSLENGHITNIREGSYPLLP